MALVEAGVLADAQACDLLAGLLALHELGDALPFTAARGDAFTNREAELRQRVGPAAAGWLSAGRPRREAFRVGLRLCAAAGARELHDALLDRAAALADLARRHADDLAADYTYLQPAQPSTVGHLLLAHADPALRDAARLRRVHAELARSVAGAGGSAGSRWPLDRARLAELLGAEGLVTHTKDAAWQADVYLELLGALATAATHLSQLAQDLEIQASQEFGQVRLAERHSRASALMPQKRNPYALAVIRAQAGTAAGDLTAALVALHTGSARTDHFHLLNTSVPRALQEAVAVARLAAAVAAGLEIDTARAGEAARRGFTVAADVADVLAMDAGLDYRSAHAVLGRAVRELTEAGLAPDALTAARIADAAEATIGRRVAPTPERLAAAMDPAACVTARGQVGSTRPGEVAAMACATEAAVAEGRAWSAAARARSGAAEAALLARARELALSGPGPDGASPPAPPPAPR